MKLTGRYNVHLPLFMPDSEECLERCIIGAAYERKWDGAFLTCRNKEHWQEKYDAGTKAFRVKLKRDKKCQWGLDARVASALEDAIPNAEAARMIAATLLQTANYLQPRVPGKEEHSRLLAEFVYHPTVLVQAMKTLGITIEDSEPYGYEKAVEALGKCKDHQAREVAAQLVVYFLRIKSDKPDQVLGQWREILTGKKGDDDGPTA